MSEKKIPAWVYQGKSVRQLIKELETFENKELEIFLSIDCGDNWGVIDLIDRDGACYLLRDLNKIGCAAPEETKKGGQVSVIRQLLEKLRMLEGQDLEVKISIGLFKDPKSISLIGKKRGGCGILSCSDFYDDKLH